MKKHDLRRAGENRGQRLIQVERGRGAERIEPTAAGFGAGNVSEPTV